MVVLAGGGPRRDVMWGLSDGCWVPVLVCCCSWGKGGGVVHKEHGHEGLRGRPNTGLCATLVPKYSFYPRPCNMWCYHGLYVM